MVEGVEFKADIKSDDFGDQVTVEVTATVRHAIRIPRYMVNSPAEAVELAMQRLGHTFEYEVFR